MDLTNEDVADILALLDSLPYDELDLETPRFRLTLRRTPAGWTQATQILSAPDPLAPAAPPLAAAAGSMSHRAGNSRLDVTSSRPDLITDGADGVIGAGGVIEEGIGEVGEGIGEAREGIGEVGEGIGEAREGIGEVGEGIGEAREGIEEVGEGGGEEAGLVAVRAPLPGTFYRAPRPGAAPFAEVGSRVGADTVIGIVETMKLMNPVHAGVAGVVAEFCVGNAEITAHGATLLRIRADP